MGCVLLLSARAARKTGPVPVTRALQQTTERRAVTLPFGRPSVPPVDGWSAFPPGAVFAQLLRAGSGRGGREAWRLAVLRAGGPGECLLRIPGVRPGAEVLLCVTGKLRTQRALRVFDAVRRLGIDPGDASPAWIAGVGAALAADLAPRPYSTGQHAAYLALRQVGG